MPRPVRFTEFPDDLLADVQRRIAGEYHAGDFTQSPWFLTSWHEQFDAWGMPLSARVRAMQGLARVYTPEVCRRLLSKPIYAGIVSPLFSAHWPGMVMTALQVGLDLAEIAPARDDQLFARLCEAREYFGAVTELHVWANILRAGLRAFRDPPGPLDSKKTPDFGAILGGRPYFIEVKASHRSAWERLAEEVKDSIESSDMMIEGYDVELLPGRFILERLDRVEAHSEIVAALDAIERAFLGRVVELREQKAPVGAYEVAPYGAVRISPVSYGKASVTCSLIPDPTPERDAKRIVSLVSDCEGHIRSGSGPGVAFIETANRADWRYVEALLRERIALHPMRFQTLSFVCLRYFRREVGREVVHEPHLISMPWHRLTRAEARLARWLTA